MPALLTPEALARRLTELQDALPRANGKHYREMVTCRNRLMGRHARMIIDLLQQATATVVGDVSPADYEDLRRHDALGNND